MQDMRTLYRNGKSRTICESIIPPENIKRCILEIDNTFKEVKKDCSDYIGNKKYEFRKILWIIR